MKHSFAFQAPKYTMILTTCETWQGKLMDLWGEIEQIQIKINHNSLLTGNCNSPPNITQIIALNLYFILCMQTWPQTLHNKDGKQSFKVNVLFLCNSHHEQSILMHSFTICVCWYHGQLPQRTKTPCFVTGIWTITRTPK